MFRIGLRHLNLMVDKINAEYEFASKPVTKARFGRAFAPVLAVA